MLWGERRGSGTFVAVGTDGGQRAGTGGRASRHRLRPVALYALCTDLIDRGFHDHPGDPRATEVPLAARLTIWPATTDRLLAAGEAASTRRGSICPPPPARLRRALGSVGRSEAAPLRRCVGLMLKPQLAIEDGANPVISRDFSRSFPNEVSITPLIRLVLQRRRRVSRAAAPGFRTDLPRFSGAR